MIVNRNSVMDHCLEVGLEYSRFLHSTRRQYLLKGVSHLTQFEGIAR